MITGGWHTVTVTPLSVGMRKASHTKENVLIPTGEIHCEMGWRQEDAHRVVEEGDDTSVRGSGHTILDVAHQTKLGRDVLQLPSSVVRDAKRMGARLDCLIAINLFDALVVHLPQKFLLVINCLELLVVVLKVRIKVVISFEAFDILKMN